jgi:hypothetical protein
MSICKQENRPKKKIKLALTCRTKKTTKWHNFIREWEGEKHNASWKGSKNHWLNLESTSKNHLPTLQHKQQKTNKYRTQKQTMCNNTKHKQLSKQQFQNIKVIFRLW